MGKTKLQNIEESVIDILRHNKPSRSNDNILYLELLKRDNINTEISLSDYLLSSNNYPNYNSVSRARRKAQEKYPELRPGITMCKIRENEKQKYIEYAIGGK